ncbi:DCC1-like thiol-disulfide oxidoreductase family protein [Sinimarinibacterium thermocellulolyticum]|uniref:HTTM domain-containing protein n=1 Tax=Sinimarinibacterium thermocellulolyticum TaxID=3170016 RepID=A0ABV2A8I7_9GAMM
MDLTQRFPRLADIFGIDLRTLALFRFALGSVLFCNLLTAFGDVGAFWADTGVMPRAWLIESEIGPRLSLFLAGGQAWFVVVLLLLQCVLALMFTLGWRTRLATIASFVMWASLLNRNPVVLIGGDLLICCLLFWSMFLPLGARFSVDAALAENPPPQENLHLSWASVGLLLQVMSVYFFSAILKSGREWVPDYTAVYYALSLDRHVLPLGKLLNEFLPLTKALSFYVWWLELLGPILIFTPLLLKYLRFGLMLCFMLMHVGFLLCLELGHFPYVSLASLTVFTGGWVWDALDRRHRRRHPQPPRIYYDIDCGFCLKSCQLFQQFLILPRSPIAPAQQTPRARTLMEANYSWVVIDGDEQAYLKWPAFTILVKHSPLLGWLYPLLRLPALERPGNAVYDFVARNRGTFGRLTAWLLPRRTMRWELGRFWNGIAAVFVVLVLVWNGHTIGMPPQASYAALTPLFRIIRIDQLWNMFAPYPLKEDGWLVVAGRLADGSEIDVLHPERGAPSFEKPRLYSQTHGGIRWLTYRGRLWEAQYANQRLYYGKYLCRSWNADKLEGDARNRRLMSFRMIYMLEMTPPPGGRAEVEQRVLWRHECFAKPGATPSP